MYLVKEFAFPAAASVLALIGAAFDLRSRRIPNFVTGPGLLAGLLLHLSLGGWRGLLDSLTACVVCGLIFLVFYLAGGMGAGDVKLVAAVACLAGLTNTPYLLLTTSLVGGVMGIGLAILRGQLTTTLLNVRTLIVHHKHQGFTAHPRINVRDAGSLRLPYGVAIATGSCLTLYLQGVQR